MSGPSHISRWAAFLAIIAGTWLLARGLYSLFVNAGYHPPASVPLWAGLLHQLQPATAFPWLMALMGGLWITGANCELFQARSRVRPLWLLSGLAGFGWTGVGTTLSMLVWTVPLSGAMVQAWRVRAAKRPAELQ